MPECDGKRLRAEALSVTFAGLDIAEMSRAAAEASGRESEAVRRRAAPGWKTLAAEHPEKAVVAQRIAEDLVGAADGPARTGSRLPVARPQHADAVAGRAAAPPPGDAGALEPVRRGLRPRRAVGRDCTPPTPRRSSTRWSASGRPATRLFVVEHELDVIRHADWIVDIGPAAGENGGRVFYSGPPAGLERRGGLADRGATSSAPGRAETARRARRDGWLRLAGITRNNLHGLDVAFPMGVLTAVTGVSGSGKSSLVSQVLVELVAEHLGEARGDRRGGTRSKRPPSSHRRAHRRRASSGSDGWSGSTRSRSAGRRGRTSRPTPGCSTTSASCSPRRTDARARGYDAGRFSFNVAKGRCATCEGEGFVMVELLFLPSVYAPCPTCHGARYNAKTLEIGYRDMKIAEVLGLTVDAACVVLRRGGAVARALHVLRQVGLGYLRLGQPATELSGGEAQRIKLATELQRVQRGDTLYVLDEPTTGLHPSDVEKLVAQIDGLVEAGNTVVVVEHDMQVVGASDWVIDIGPGAGDEGGRVVAMGPPAAIAESRHSATAPYIARLLPAVVTG